MIQQINLYQPLLRRQKKVFSFRTMAQITAILIIGMLLIYAYGRWQTRLLDQQLTQLRDQERAAVTRLTELTRKADGRGLLALDARIQALRGELDARRRILAHMSGRELGNTGGFGAHLSGLARQTVEGLWLTRVWLADGGARVALHGNTYSPELMPRYLQKLGSEEAFNGTQFKQVRMYLPEDTASRHVAFSLSSEAERPEARR